MAAKKQTRKPAASKSNATARGKSGGNKSGATRYAASVIIFAAAILLFCIAVVKGENVWTALHTFWLGLAGFSAYIWPAVMIYAAVLLAMDRERPAVTRPIICSGVLLLTVQTLVDIFLHTGKKIGYWDYLVSVYKSGAKGGGFFGAVFGDALCLALGNTGAKILIVLLTFVFLMLLTGTTLMSLFRTVSTPAKKIKEAAEVAYGHASQLDAEGDGAKQQKPDLEATNRHPYDVPIGDEDPINPAGDVQVDLKKQSRKMVDAFNSASDSVVPDINGAGAAAPDSANTHGGEERSAENEETGSAIDSIIKGLNSKLDVISADDPKLAARSAADSAGKKSDEADGEFEAPEDEEENPVEYVYPPLSLLKKAPADNATDIRAELSTNAEKLVDTLRSFGVETRVINISRGPSVTRYELQPAAGVRISRIANLTDDLALSLASSGVRIEAPIPNKAAVGIEVPNKARSSVSIRELIESSGFTDAKSKLTGVLGKDITGESCFIDIAKMPHILIAGTTGSGKSVCLNSIIISMLYKADPSELKMLMIDPKAVEMKVYNGIPHLLVPVVTDPKKAAGALGWAVTEMLRRYQLLSEHDVRNIDGYNELAEHDDSIKKLPKIVIFIDEFADLMMAAPGEVEDSVCRLAQMARAAGMHLVIATQSPRADVITGLIKSNIPSRISLKVASPLESRIILDMQGAERLIGYGDMLYSPTGANKPVRIQGCWISDGEIKAVTDFLKGKSGHAGYDDEIMQEIERQAALAKQGKKNGAADSDSDEVEDDDPMLEKALEVVVDMGQASTSMLQRKLKLGYSRAARIMDQLESHGYIGPAEGAKPRAVKISKSQLLEMQAGSELPPQ